MNAQPLVSVLMPVYNGEKYLSEAIDSIQAQTYTNFEFLIINDGSTDSTESIILSYNDSRIKYIKNEENIRLISSLNKGINLAKGEYIVRFDADDISLPTRIEKQVSYMQSNPQIGLCGSYIESIGNGSTRTVTYQTDNDNIKFRLLFDTHFPHPAAVLRKSVLIENNLKYELEYIHAEDYVLWNQMAKHCQIHILPEVLVQKREHAGQVSVIHNELQQQIMSEYRKQIMEDVAGTITSSTYNLYVDLLKGVYPSNKESAIALINFLNTFVVENNKYGIYNKNILQGYFTKLTHSIVYNSSGLGIKVFWAYNKSLFSMSQNAASAVKLFIKYLIKKKPVNKLIIQTI